MLEGAVPISFQEMKERMEKLTLAEKVDQLMYEICNLNERMLVTNKMLDQSADKNAVIIHRAIAVLKEVDR